jgi:FMN phosphatase YigB (HAD superfamily)
MAGLVREPLFDWEMIRMVVFDVDGTLYRQRSLRLRMARSLLWHTLKRRDSRTVSVLKAYRSIREKMADSEVHDFGPALLTETAQRTGCDPATVNLVVRVWINERPLRYLPNCVYPGVAALFDAVRQSGRLLGVWSDYPAREKLAAMGLAADHVVSADDSEIGILKPHPRGLLRLAALGGVSPTETVLIGDRAERDGMAAQRAGAKALLRSTLPIAGWRCFSRYDDVVFAPLLDHLRSPEDSAS